MTHQYMGILKKLGLVAVAAVLVSGCAGARVASNPDVPPQKPVSAHLIVDHRTRATEPAAPCSECKVLVMLLNNTRWPIRIRPLYTFWASNGGTNEVIHTIAEEVETLIPGHESLDLTALIPGASRGGLYDVSVTIEALPLDTAPRVAAGKTTPDPAEAEAEDSGAMALAWLGKTVSNGTSVRFEERPVRIANIVPDTFALLQPAAPAVAEEPEVVATVLPEEQEATLEMEGPVTAAPTEDSPRESEVDKQSERIEMPLPHVPHVPSTTGVDVPGEKNAWKLRDLISAVDIRKQLAGLLAKKAVLRLPFQPVRRGGTSFCGFFSVLR